MSEEKKPAEQLDAAQTEQELARKRNAFLRYMTIVFAVAFLLVLVSLVLQMHTAKAAMSDLKEQVDALTAELAEADEAHRAQAERIAALEKELAEAKDAGSELSEEKLARAETIQAYDALLTALRCTTREGNVTFSKAIGTVESYKDRLSEAALAVYEGLLEE